ncbi:MAG: hypothetical protein IPM48_04940 [Saprospiraceae bacterium]|nr:hypothetical protein [Saprospiraceae bacterium]
MKNILSNFPYLFILCLVFFDFCSSDSKKWIEEKYENGNIKRRYYKINDLVQDTMREFYNTGELKAIYLFKDGKQHGCATRYYKSGELEEVQYFEFGLQQLGDTVFYKNGRIKFTAEMKDDKKNGYFRRHSEFTDSVELEQLFRNDTIVIYTDSEEKE